VFKEVLTMLHRMITLITSVKKVLYILLSGAIGVLYYESGVY